MYFWKLDDETIRCLINKEEVDQMGFDYEGIRSDDHHMEEFLEAVIRNSRQYINWNTENGLQTYSARELSSEQLLLTISCTFTDVAIDRDLNQIRKMTDALQKKISPERLNEIFDMQGEEKERAFESLARDLRDVCLGNFDTEDVYDGSDEGHAQDVTGADGEDLTAYLLTFSEFDRLLAFCSLWRKYQGESLLYKMKETYYLIARQKGKKENRDSFLLTAEEFGASCNVLGHEEAWLAEHGKLLIGQDAIPLLSHMS